MNKKMAILSLTAALAIGGVMGGTLFRDRVASADETGAVVGQTAGPAIGLEEAVRIAREAVDGGRVDGVELERNRGQALYYEVEIEASDGEYEIKVDAATGEVLRIKRDDDRRDGRRSSDAAAAAVTGQADSASNAPASSADSDPASSAFGQPSAEAPVNAFADAIAAQQAAAARATLITAEQAAQIAVDRVGGRVVDVELDRDDGILRYEVELKLSGGREAEVDVDAATGNVLEIDIDDDDDDD